MGLRRRRFSFRPGRGPLCKQAALARHCTLTLTEHDRATRPPSTRSLRLPSAARAVMFQSSELQTHPPRRSVAA